MTSLSNYYDHPAISATYDLVESAWHPDVRFYLNQAKRSKGPILEVGCGTGRILLPVAESGGGVWGIDASPDMLHVLRERMRSLDRNVVRRIRLRKADMRSLHLKQRFGCALIPCRTFTLNLTPQDQRKTLTCVRRHLRRGAILALDQFDPPIDYLAELKASGKRKLRLVMERQNRECRIRVFRKSSLDQARQIITASLVHEIRLAGHKKPKTVKRVMRLRYTYRTEMEHLFELCGFEVEALYRDFKGHAFRPGEEQVWVCRAKRNG